MKKENKYQFDWWEQGFHLIVSALSTEEAVKKMEEKLERNHNVLKDQNGKEYTLDLQNYGVQRVSKGWAHKYGPAWAPEWSIM